MVLVCAANVSLFFVRYNFEKTTIYELRKVEIWAPTHSKFQLNVSYCGIIS